LETLSSCCHQMQDNGQYKDKGKTVVTLRVKQLKKLILANLFIAP